MQGYRQRRYLTRLAFRTFKNVSIHMVLDDLRLQGLYVLTFECTIHCKHTMASLILPPEGIMQAVQNARRQGGHCCARRCLNRNWIPFSVLQRCRKQMDIIQESHQDSLRAIVCAKTTEFEILHKSNTTLNYRIFDYGRVIC